MNTKAHSKYYGPLLMLGASICFAGGGAAIKFIPWNALAINGVRNIIAAFTFLIYMIVTKHRFVFNRMVFLGSIAMFCTTTLFVVANKLTFAGNVIILQYTCTIWIILMMAFFFRQKPSKLQLLTIVLVFTGIACFFFDSISAGGTLGNLIAILSGFFYAGMFMLNQFESGDTISSMFLGQLLCGILLGPTVLKESDFSPSVILAVLFLGVIQVALAYMFFNEGTKYTHPVTASLINGVEPILNPIIVAIMFHEILPPLSIVGALIVVISIVYYNIRSL